jgi:two-component system sensor histidine kinase/response regulator
VQDERGPRGARKLTELELARQLLDEAAESGELPISLRMALGTVRRALDAAHSSGFNLELEGPSFDDSIVNPFEMPGEEPPDLLHSSVDDLAEESALELAERLVAERRAAQSAVHAWADELRRARARLFDAIDALDAGFLMFGPDERMIICNRRYKELYPDVAPFMEAGATITEIAQNWLAANGGRTLDGGDGRAWLMNRLAAHRSAPRQIEELDRGRWIRTSDRRTQDGGVVSLRTDITSLKMQGEELRRAKDAAEAASRAKSEFLANISHEIRTPMNGILGMTELTLDTELNAEQREYLRLIQTSGHHLLSVINDVLDLSKIEAGKMTLEQTDFSLADMLEAELRTLAMRAEQKGLRLRFSCAPEVPDGLLGDPLRLRQVLINLLGNALKFTEAGELELSVQLAGTPPRADALRLRFAVRDTGIGIPLEKQEAIFEAFAQADSSTTRKFGGTGLGLTISARLVEQMGGRLEVESAAGQGSTFSFTVPFGRGAPLRKPRSSEGLTLPGRERLRVLVAEDQSVNRFYVRRLLEKMGHQVALVVDGQEALEITAQEPFDLVLMDVQMPRLSGLEASEAIRARERASGSAQRLPIWALTAHALLGDAEKCLAAGMDGYLTKPIDRGALQAALASVPGKAQAGESAASPVPRAPASPLPIYDRAASLKLLGEDREFVRELAAMGVEELPKLVARVRTAPGGSARSDAAHALKGAAASLSLPRLTEVARKIEREKDPPSPAELAHDLDRLDAELAAAIPALRDLAQEDESP